MTRLSYIIRKYPLARLIALAVFIAAGVFLLSLLTRTVSRKPFIKSISPKLGTPGELLVIEGHSFGNTRGSGYVEICGSRVTESSYVSWQNDEIKIVIPGNTEDGFVYVVNRGGKSNPEFFVNEAAVPVCMPLNPLMSTPTISEISPETVFAGQVLVISGENFGNTRENSVVYFTAHKDENASEEITDYNSLDSFGSRKIESSSYPPLGSKHKGFVMALEEDFDYEYWSETEIRVRVPDGAQTGSVFVATENGQSTMQPITVRRRAGEKSFKYKHTYLLQVEANVSGIKGSKDATITLRMPHPAVYSQQPEITITETKPEPELFNYKNTSIFQVPYDGNANNNFNAKQNFVVECYSAETWVNRDMVNQFKDTDRMLYRAYTRADEIIPANAFEIKDLLPNIIFQIKNPYRQAEAVFNYMVANFKVTESSRKQSSTPLDLIRRKKGDAYDFAVVYTALLRAAGVPARMLSGILVNADKRTQNHWWCEFYIEDFGWIPVDVALGAGMQFEPFQNERHYSKYYFGSIDAQHIAFSLNYNMSKPSLLNNKVVFMPRSYALQSVWEESSAEIESYSSYWATPVVLGIY